MQREKKQAKQPEASAIVPEFTILEYGSSCKYIFFGLILAHLLFLSIYWNPILPWGHQKVDR